MTATKYMACSDGAGRSLYGEKFFSKYGVIIKNGILVETFTKPDPQRVGVLKEEFRITEKNNLICGNISRFEDRKNQLFALAVFQQVIRRHPDAVLLLGGVDAGLLSKTQDYVLKHGLETHVRFIGKRDDISECLNLIDVYIFPSKYEGLGIALMEAQAAGCLCVAATTVPKETDMGIENIFYLSLMDSPEYWAEIICDKFEKRVIPTEKTIHQKFAQMGFDVRKSAEELVMYYE